MRPYRGKRIDNGDWVTGSLIQLNSGLCYITENIHGLHLPLDGKLICNFTHKVDPDTAGQAIGFKDRRDRNKGDRQDIYRDDIIYRDFRNFTAVVVWNKHYAAFMWLRIEKYGDGIPDKDGAYEFFDSETVGSNIGFLVIGNIHDNPELIK